MKSLRFLPLALSAIALSVQLGVKPLGAKGLSFESPSTQVTLLELYSSEGCSSCPKADEWVGGLKKSPHLWKRFVPVVFHVDYWDRIGWKDGFADPAFTQRQEAYVRHWASRSMYTPAFILNSDEWRGWYHWNRVPEGNGEDAGVLSVSRLSREDYQVAFHPTEAGEGRYVANAALLGVDLVTDVKAGENRGRQLHHNFVVLTLSKQMMNGHGEFFKTTLSLPEREDLSAPRYAVAFWVTAKGNSRPIQATGGYLP